MEGGGPPNTYTHTHANTTHTHTHAQTSLHPVLSGLDVFCADHTDRQTDSHTHAHTHPHTVDGARSIVQ